MVNLCLWVNNSITTITHSFQGKATSSPSQFPWTSLSWLIKLCLLTALSISRDSLLLPFIFNILLVFFLGRRLSLYSRWVTNLIAGLQSWVNLSLYTESVRNSKAAGKFSIFFKHTGAQRFINTKPSAFSMTILNALGRGISVYTVTVRHVSKLLLDRLESGWWKNKLLSREANIYILWFCQDILVYNNSQKMTP